ncbi:peptidase inhibitor family I36 protein [Microbispora sp. H10885]|uniref:peptidase inhibitor family I36 protein n=1 Tax=Microbispora sp. H10885 TaxID=2729110 RepID=UPI0016035C9F|nr:peptidase inhibitor family I36 protein [Microbispora sp. H10885]
MSAGKSARRAALALALGVATLVIVAPPASAGHDGTCNYAIEDGDVCLYRLANFTGGMLDFTRSDRNYTSAADVFYSSAGVPTSTNINDQATSIVNYEGYCEWWFYTDAEWGGYGFTMGNIQQSWSNIGTWDNRLSSHYKWTGWTECTNGSTG